MPGRWAAWRRTAPLLVSLCLVLGLGLVAFAAHRAASNQATDIHRTDRSQVQGVLAGLTNQYLQFSALELDNFGASGDWTLRPNSRVDATRLLAYVRTSPLFDQGAALVTLSGQPITVASLRPGLPTPTDPGFLPLAAALKAGRPGVSSVMHVAGVPEIAIGVPIMRAGKPAALILGFADLRRWALEGYVQRLKFGPTSHAYVLDGSGVAVSAPFVADVGRPVPQTAVVSALGAGRSGIMDYRRGRTRYVASYATTGLDGWSVFTEQTETAFAGALNRAGTVVDLAVIALLVAAAGVVLLFNQRRTGALRRLAESALYDPITGLPFRRLLLDRLGAALARHRRTRAGVAVLFCDLDGFKAINDRFGHNRGDLVLKEVANRLRMCIREEDTAARYGGDEFVVLVEGVSDAEAVRALADRVRRALGHPMELGGQPLRVGVSVGGAVLTTGHDTTADDLLNAADLGMYEAKVSGAGCHVVSFPVLPGVAETRVPDPRVVGQRDEARG